jgi:hypothetical protein
VVDVSDPVRPVEVGSSAIPLVTSIEQLFAANGRLYLVVQRSGDPNGEATWELQVIDVSTPTRPTLVGAFTPQFPALYQVLAVAAGYLYFVDRQGQLRLADVSDPAVLREVGPVLSFSPSGYVQAMDIAGNELYLGLNELGIAIFKQP